MSCRYVDGFGSSGGFAPRDTVLFGPIEAVGPYHFALSQGEIAVCVKLGRCADGYTQFPRWLVGLQKDVVHRLDNVELEPDDDVFLCEIALAVFSHQVPHFTRIGFGEAESWTQSGTRPIIEASDYDLRAALPEGLYALTVTRAAILLEWRRRWQPDAADLERMALGVQPVARKPWAGVDIEAWADEIETARETLGAIIRMTRDSNGRGIIVLPDAVTYSTVAPGAYCGVSFYDDWRPALGEPQCVTSSSSAYTSWWLRVSEAQLAAVRAVIEQHKLVRVDTELPGLLAQ